MFQSCSIEKARRPEYKPGPTSPKTKLLGDKVQRIFWYHRRYKKSCPVVRLR